YALGAYATAIVTTRLGLPFPLPLLLAVAFAAAMSVLIALPALRVSGHYLVVVSLALQIIVIEVILNWTSLTGGTDGISAVPAYGRGIWPLDSPGRFLIAAVIGAAACFWICWRLAH